MRPLGTRLRPPKGIRSDQEGPVDCNKQLEGILRRRPIFRTIVLALLAAILAVGDPDVSAGADYYFSTSGNDSWRGGLPEPNADGTDGPWKSLSKIFVLSKKNALQPGDRLLLKRGNSWNELDHKSIMWLEGLEGTAEHPITIGAYGVGKKPVLSGAGSDRPHTIIRAQHIHHVRIQDLRLIGGAQTREFLWLRADTHESGTTHVQVLRCKFDNTVEDQVEGGTGIFMLNPFGQSRHPESNLPYANPLHHIEVGWSTFYGIGGMPGTTPNKVDAINVGAPKGGHIWIHHNEFYWTADSAIDIAGESNHLVEHNKIIGISINGGIKFHSQFSHLSNSTIRGNLIVGGDWAMAIEATSGVRIFNNTTYPKAGKSLVAWFGDMPTGQYGTFEDNEIRNNIFWGFVYMAGAAGPSIGTTNTFSNNIYYNDRSRVTQLFYFQETGEIIKGNEFAAKWLSQPGVTDDRNVDPKLVNPFFTTWNHYGDFHLAPGSAAIDAGTDVGMTADLDGKSVPRGLAPDVGAYEFVGPP